MPQAHLTKFSVSEMHLLSFVCIVSFYASCHGLNLSDFKHWFDKVSDPKFECPIGSEDLASNDLIVKTVSCEDEGAIFMYDYKTSGGHKPKRGPFNGLGTLTFGQYGSNEKLNYGLKHNKCLKLGYEDVKKVTGTFVNDLLEGQVTIFLVTKDFITGYARGGKLVGVHKTFTQENLLANISDTSGKLYFKAIHNNTAILGCQPHQFGDECLVTDWEKVSICNNVDGDFFANCHVPKSLSNYKLDGCKILQTEIAEKVQDGHFNMILSLGKRAERNVHQQQNETVQCESSLIQWVEAASDPMLFWDEFNTDFDPLEKTNPKLDIAFSAFKGRPGFKEKTVVIFSSGGKLLLKTQMVNGQIEAKVDPLEASHPGWRTRLLICLDAKTFVLKDTQNYVKLKQDNCPLRVQGALKNGQLYGIVQMFGVVSVEKFSSCSDKISKGLSYIGRYQDGIPIGPSWRGLIGRSWLHGKANAKGEFTGSDISYIYPDLELAMIGDFENGIMINGRESKVDSFECNLDGIAELKFSQPKGLIYHFEKPSNASFGDQPHLQDPLDKKYVYIQKSKEFPDADANEGAFAAQDVPKSTVYVLNGGYLLSNAQYEAYIEQLHANHDIKTIERENMNTHTMKTCGATGIIPFEYSSTSKYQGTMGHKANHHFDANSAQVEVDTPRFGVINAYITTKAVKKGEEFLANYQYSLENAPNWYLSMYLDFIAKNPHLQRQSSSTDSQWKNIK